ncbi:MAG: hypothetical protein CMF31_03665 [Kordiimonas sp.]|nr:hypothetical protein [Kordiimonas sp.]|tara:strand:+ start:2517 stop:3803 length:1287 start_codon:yes stop_codon:yes gene_type:complete
MDGQRGITVKTRDWLEMPQVRKVLKTLNTSADDSSGAIGDIKARFVGGCVRDALLGHSVSDIDIATSHSPERVTALLEAVGAKVIPTGLKHGTVTAVLGHRHFEITTLRRDVETYGRHASVAYTDNWQEDARRRDFTLNALYMDIDETVYDPSGDGVADLHARRVRFIGEATDRIREDALRILRFFRFSARFCKEGPDAEGLAACIALSDRLEQLSGERLLQETLKILLAPRAVDMLKVMADEGVLSHFLPGPYAFDDLRHLVGLENVLEKVDAERRLACLLSPLAGISHPLVRHLKLSNRQQKRLSSMIVDEMGHEVDLGLDRHDAARLLYRAGAESFMDNLLLQWARCGLPPEDKKGQALLMQAADWCAPVFPVRGADLKRLGVEAGPVLGQLKAQLEDWWINENFQPEKDDLLQQAQKIMSMMPR